MNHLTTEYRYAINKLTTSGITNEYISVNSEAVGGVVCYGTAIRFARLSVSWLHAPTEFVHLGKGIRVMMGFEIRPSSEGYVRATKGVPYCPPNPIAFDIERFALLMEQLIRTAT